MFSRSRLSPHEEQHLLSHTSHDTAPSSASPMSTSHPHYLGSYETLARRQSLAGEKDAPTIAIEKPTGDTHGPNTALSDPTLINDPFTGEPEARLSPDAGTSMFEGHTNDTGLQHQFWSHVVKIRQLQSEVAKMHIAMESTDPQIPAPPPIKEKEKPKERRRGQTNIRTGTTSTAVNTDREELGHSASDTDHTGSGRDSNAKKKKATTIQPPVVKQDDDPFTKRQAEIRKIVKKLTELSQEVTEFHQLPPSEITIPASPTRQVQVIPQTPPHPSTLTVPSPAHPPHTPHSRPNRTQRHPLPGYHQPTQLSIPTTPITGHSSDTPSKTKHLSVIGEPAFHDSPVSIQNTNSS